MSEKAEATQETLDAIIERDPAGDEIVMPKEDEMMVDPLVYFCKSCNRLVQNPKAKSKAKPYTFFCPECKEENISWGTKRSVYSFFHLNEDGEITSKKKKEKGNQVARLKEVKEEAKERRGSDKA